MRKIINSETNDTVAPVRVSSELNREQLEALKAADSCEDLYISGGAGTEKSYLIRTIKRCQ